MPSMTGKEAIQALESYGWTEVSVRGSHHKLKHPKLGTFIVPVHGKKALSRGLYNKVIKLIAESMDS